MLNKWLIIWILGFKIFVNIKIFKLIDLFFFVKIRVWVFWIFVVNKVDVDWKLLMIIFEFFLWSGCLFMLIIVVFCCFNRWNIL